MRTIYQLNGLAKPITRTTVFTKKEDRSAQATQGHLRGRILTYCVAGTFGLVSPGYLQANAATSNWDISRIAVNACIENSDDTTGISEQDIAHIRTVTKISVTELARVFGVSRQSVHEWIKGGALSPQNAQRLWELAQATDVFLEAGIEPSPEVFRRKVAGGQSIFEAISDSGNAVSSAKTLVATLIRESEQRQRLAARLAGKPATPNTEFGSPHLDENA